MKKETVKIKYKCSYCGGFELERPDKIRIYPGKDMTYDITEFSALHISLTNYKNKTIKEERYICPICLFSALGINLPESLIDSNKQIIKGLIKLFDTILDPGKK